MKPVLHFARRVVVAGDSMVPAFRPGDRLLVVAFPRYRAGDAVALVDPRDTTRVVVKRVASVGLRGRHYEVLGDNAAASTDSRTFGPVPRGSILGRVVYRYAPAERVGRMRRR